MKKFLLPVIFIFTLAAGCVQVQPQNQPTTGTLPGNNANIPATTATPTTTTPTVPATTTTEPKATAPVDASKTETITIANFSFSPAQITINSGDSIKWVNQDSVTHQIKSDTFASQPLNNGDSFEYQFQNAGTYEYSCLIHPSMKGTVIVK